MDLSPHLEGLLRELAPQTLAALTRRYGHFDLAEDAVQEALLAAASSWSERRPPRWCCSPSAPTHPSPRRLRSRSPCGPSADSAPPRSPAACCCLKRRSPGGSPAPSRPSSTPAGGSRCPGRP